MSRDVSGEDRVSGPVVGLSLCERKSVRYSGALPWRHLKTYIQILNVMRSRMGSQCKVFMRGDALSRLQFINVNAFLWKCSYYYFEDGNIKYTLHPVARLIMYIVKEVKIHTR